MHALPPTPLAIAADDTPSAPRVHYKAFSDSWVMLLSCLELYAADLLLPQICSKRFG